MLHSDDEKFFESYASLKDGRLLLAAARSNGEPIPMAFVGAWQSDETLTLASMSESELVTPEDRERFSDNFFGDRVIVFAPRKGKAFWVVEDWIGVEQEPQWFQGILSPNRQLETFAFGREATVAKIRL